MTLTSIKPTICTGPATIFLPAAPASFSAIHLSYGEKPPTPVMTCFYVGTLMAVRSACRGEFRSLWMPTARAIWDGATGERMACRGTPLPEPAHLLLTCGLTAL